MGVVTINQAVDGLTAVNAASLNTNFNAIANVLNGNIDGNNITNAAINASKINWSATGSGAGLWWEEMARSTLAVAGDTMTLNFTARRYLHIRLLLLATAGTISSSFRFNGDTANNYSYRYYSDGNSGTAVSQGRVGTLGATSDILEATLDITNIASTKKAGKASSVGAASSAAGNTDYVDFAFTWVNTSSVINSITVFNEGTGDFAIGSEIVVLGHD